jgi:hypothetical protein
MEKCAKCKLMITEKYVCEHTHWVKFCAECYQQLHWDLTNKL